MAATSAVKPGIKGNVYRNTGTYGSPTWTAMTLVRSVTPSPGWNMANADVRATRAILQAKTQMALSAQIEMRADDADAAYLAMWAAAMSPTAVLDMLILDGAITTEGAMGFRAEWNVTLTGQPQGQGDVIYSTFDVTPAFSSNGYPKSVVMGATSTLTETAF